MPPEGFHWRDVAVSRAALFVHVILHGLQATFPTSVCSLPGGIESQDSFDAVLATMPPEGVHWREAAVSRAAPSVHAILHGLQAPFPTSQELLHHDQKLPAAARAPSPTNAHVPAADAPADQNPFHAADKQPFPHKGMNVSNRDMNVKAMLGHEQEGDAGDKAPSEEWRGRWQGTRQRRGVKGKTA